VEKPDFLKVLQHYSRIDVKDAEAVLTLKETFPFSQLLHILAARVSRDHGFSNYGSFLHQAAVHAADRAVLKEIVEGELNSTLVPLINANVVREADLANEVIDDLERLSKLKQNFELLFIDPAATSQIQETPIIAEADTTIPAQTTAETAPREVPKSKKERIVELAKTLTTPIQETVVQVDANFKTRRRKKDVMDSYIDQIAVSKEEIVPESEKQREQIEIIDHFIKVQPSITGSKDKQALLNDLSTIKTGEFTDNIISETLVQILVKQGKKEKAVEVLKKLIWKFPQKKAYFATQIEELKK
jgi:hypothetical protein